MEKLTALFNIPIPENKKQLKSALGGIGYYRRFIPMYSNKIRCLQELLRNDVPFVWEQKHTDAFLDVRGMLRNIPTLAYPDESPSGGQFFLTTDASLSAASYVLTQVQRQPDGKEQEVLIACGGRALRDSETRWPAIHLEALAVILGVMAYRHYFVGRKVTVRTDSLTVRWVKDLKKSRHGRLFRWGLFLDSVPSLSFEHVPGRLNVLADCLSRRPYGPPPPADEKEADLLAEDIACVVSPSDLCLDDVLLSDDEYPCDPAYLRNHYDECFDVDFSSFESNDTGVDVVSGSDSECESDPGSCCSCCCIGLGCRCVSLDENVLAMTSPRAHAEMERSQFTEDCADNQESEPSLASHESHGPYSVVCLSRLRDALNQSGPQGSIDEPDRQSVDAIVAKTLMKKIQERGASRAASSVLQRCAVASVVQLPVSTDPSDASSEGIAELFQFASSENDLGVLQSEDKVLQPIIDFLKTGELPHGNDKLCRRLMFEREFYYLNDDSLLCRAKMFNRKDAKAADVLFEDTEVLVLPDSVVDEVLHAYHDSSHYGIARLAENVSRRYSFDGFFKRIRDFVHKCPVCAKAKSHLPPRAKLGETPVATRPAEIYSMDIVSGLSTTKKGHSYILSIQDHFTRYIWLYALCDMKSQTIAEKLLLTISQGGVPDMLVTDLGANLVGSLMTQVYQLLGIKKRQTFAYSSKSLGLAERYHRTMGASLRSLLLEFKDKDLEWDDLLPMVELSFRCSASPTSHLSPMDLWLGRSVRMPIDLALGSPEPFSAGATDEYMQTIRRRLELMYRLHQENEAASRKEMIQRYDEKRARPCVFQKDQLVYLNNPAPLDGTPRKLAPLWIGPFEITEVTSPHSVKLRDLLTQKDLSSDVHIDRLKKCWSSRESFLHQPPVSVESPDPECIVQQKGQGSSPKFLVRFRVKSDGSRIPDKWLRFVEVPAPLVAEWRKFHRKDGAVRKRKDSHQQDPIDLESDAESNNGVSCGRDARHKGRKVVFERSQKSQKSVPSVLRRSSRNVPRVDYKEYDDDEFE